MNCKNCNHTIQNNYCSHCGQKTSVSKVTMSNLIAQLSNSLFQVNKGFFYTLRELFTRPGKTIREYLDGKRKRHFKPIAYVLTLSTVYYLITQLGGHATWIDDAITGWSNRSNDTGVQSEVPLAFTWFAKNYAYATLLSLPIFSFATYLTFSKLGRNYLEHIVINSYAIGQQAILYSFFSLLFTVSGFMIFDILPIFVAIAYNGWVFCQFFEEKGRLGIVVRLFLAYIFYIILGSGFSFLIMSIVNFLK